MSWYGMHPLRTRAEVKEQRIADGSPPCRHCEYVQRLFGAESGPMRCFRCSGSRAQIYACPLNGGAKPL